jgi:hypothetical protein
MALTGLVPHLPEGLREQALGEALNAAREVQNAYSRAEALASLVPHLPGAEREQVLGEALAAARKIQDRDYRARAPAYLTPHLPEGLREQVLEEALVAAREMPDEYQRADVLAALIPHLPAGLREQAIEEALDANRESELEADDELADLAHRLATLPRPALYFLWARTLPILARNTREDLLADLRFLAPILTALGGEKAVVETFRAIQDVVRWWP